MLGGEIDNVGPHWTFWPQFVNLAQHLAPLRRPRRAPAADVSWLQNPRTLPPTDLNLLGDIDPVDGDRQCRFAILQRPNLTAWRIKGDALVVLR